MDDLVGHAFDRCSQSNAIPAHLLNLFATSPPTDPLRAHRTTSFPLRALAGRLDLARRVACAWAVVAATENTARAAICPASGYETQATNRDAAMIEAGVLATGANASSASRSSKDALADARAVYLWVLARYPDDPEALYGLARIDAWEGCWDLSEREYVRALSKAPRDAELRAGLIDLWTWQNRILEAEKLLETGLALDPKSPALLARRAKFAYFRGDSNAAVESADEALARSPDDADIRAVRDRLFLNEVSAAAHIDRYPYPYPDIDWIGVQYLRRIHRYEVYGGAQLLQRAGAGIARVLDARFPLGVVYHPAMGTLVGAEITPGAPANAIPNLTLRGWALTPLTPLFSAGFGYAFWHFDDGATVHILQPNLGVNLPANLRVEARAWIAILNLPSTDDPPKPGSAKLAAAVGPAVEWTVGAPLTLGAYYTYGAELDQNPVRYQLLTFSTNSFGFIGDVRIQRSGPYKWGLRPMIGTSRRHQSVNGEAIWIGSTELGAYFRW